MSIGSVFVAGAGTMGHGIAQVCAAAGVTVKLNDVDHKLIDKGIARIAASLDRMVQKSKLTAEDRDKVLARVTPALSLDEAGGADLVVEAVVEHLDTKLAVFKKLDAAVPKETILATNTSSLSVTKIASVVSRPERVIGMHFFNPVPIMQLVEIIKAVQTDDATFAAIREFAVQVGKTPVGAKDLPGFISNRILMVMINEAIFTLYEGVGTAEEIDSVMKLGMNHPMGPLALADMIGLDVCLSVCERLYTGFGDPKFRPCPLLVSLVEAGRLGRKTGRGFYTY